MNTDADDHRKELLKYKNSLLACTWGLVAQKPPSIPLQKNCYEPPFLKWHKNV